MIKFFTLPPITIPYPYVLINLNHPQLKYIYKYYRNIKEVIIDSGIEIFRNPNIKDYPPSHERKLVRCYHTIRNFVKNVYVTCPDYCDDYHPKSLWLSDNYTNIERTVDNVLYYTSKYDFNWLIPIQGHYKKPNSVFKCLKYYDKYGIIDKFNYFAIGTLCIEPDIRIIIKTISNVRSILEKDKKLHVFGLKIKALKYVSHLIDSFDSMAWTRPVDSSIRKYFPDRKNRSVKGTSKINSIKMREIYFLKYLERLKVYGVRLNED